MGIRYLLILALRYNNCGRGSYEFTKRTRVAAPIGACCFFCNDAYLLAEYRAAFFGSLPIAILRGHLYGLS